MQELEELIVQKLQVLLEEKKDLRTPMKTVRNDLKTLDLIDKIA